MEAGTKPLVEADFAISRIIKIVGKVFVPVASGQSSQHFSNGADPKLIAQAFVGEALRANKKLDDTSREG